MFSGFKEFVLRGNVIDLAVAVVIGAAFTGVVNAIVENVFNPLIGAIWDADTLKTALPVPIGNATLQFGAVAGALIQFLIVAVVVYFAFVMPMNHLKHIAFRKQQLHPAENVVTPPSDSQLLLEIRDLLAAQNESMAARDERPRGAHTADLPDSTA